MAFLGLLVASGGHSLPPLLVDALLALNPTDAYRLLTLGTGGTGGLTGIGALAGHTALTPPVLVAVLLAWTAAPLALAALVFSRRELVMLPRFELPDSIIGGSLRRDTHVACCAGAPRPRSRSPPARRRPRSPPPMP